MRYARAYPNPPFSSVHLVVPENLPELQRRIESLSRRAVKLGMGPITLVVGAMRKIRPQGAKHDEIRQEVTVTGETPVVNGWEFVATLQHEEGGTILRIVPGTNLDPTVSKRYRTAQPDCDHCQLNRRRGDTFLLREISTGRVIQVGRSCLRDFLGHADPHALAAMAEYLIAADGLAAIAEESGGGAGGRAGYFDLTAFVAVTIYDVSKNGYVSRAKADAEGIATTARAVTFLLNEPRKVAEILNPALMAAATDLIAFAKTQLDRDPDSLSDYEHNLRVALLPDIVGPKTAGIVASLVPYVNRIKGQIAERATALPSTYLAPVESKFQTLLTILRVHTFETAYGAMTIVNMTTPQGNLVVWKTKYPRVLMLDGGDRMAEVGETYEAEGTVKEHKEAYKRPGVPETVVTRVTFAEIGWHDLQARKAAQEKALKELTKAQAALARAKSPAAQKNARVKLEAAARTLRDLGGVAEGACRGCGLVGVCEC